MKHVKLYENFERDSKPQKASIFIKIRKEGNPRYDANIDVQYDMDLGASKIKEIGDAIQSLDENADITIEYSVFNSISDTWMNMMSYYPSEERLVHH